jgi:hypothetical protein
MEYQYLTEDDRRAALEARLRQLESEHLGHATNRSASASTGDEEGVKTAEAAMATIDAAYEAARAELATLDIKGAKRGR